jgi:hypothetical protein
MAWGLDVEHPAGDRAPPAAACIRRGGARRCHRPRSRGPALLHAGEALSGVGALRAPWPEPTPPLA